MAKHKYGNMPNESKGGGSMYSDTDSGKMGSNSGATGGLKKSNDLRADVTAKPSTRNPYPDGMA